jgi:hypothetical protein
MLIRRLIVLAFIANSSRKTVGRTGLAGFYLQGGRETGGKAWQFRDIQTLQY